MFPQNSEPAIVAMGENSMRSLQHWQALHPG